MRSRLRRRVRYTVRIIANRPHQCKHKLARKMPLFFWKILRQNIVFSYAVSCATMAVFERVAQYCVLPRHRKEQFGLDNVRRKPCRQGRCPDKRRGNTDPWQLTTGTRAPGVLPPREEADRPAQRAAREHRAPADLRERRAAAHPARPRGARRKRNQHSNGLSTGILRFAWSSCWRSLRFSFS